MIYITRKVSVKQRTFEPVEYELTTWDHKTKQDVTYRTAQEHGCKRLNCRRHWKRVELPEKVVTVDISIDTEGIAMQAARAAAGNLTGRSTAIGGLVRARIQR